MAVISIVKLLELEGAKRIDAEYYKPEYIPIYKLLANFRCQNLDHLSFFVKKGIFDISPSLYKENGIPLIRVQNIRSGFLEETELVFISEETHQREVKTELESHDLVLSKVGTIGEVSIVPLKYGRANFSQNVIGIKVKKQEIPRGYLLSFLLSKYGQLQLKRVQMPQVQSKLELEPVRKIVIPRLSKEIENKINDIILNSEKNYEESKSFYSQAEDLLLQELGLKDFRPQYKKTYTAKFSDAFSSKRIDAEYFQPAYEEVMERIRKKGVDFYFLKEVFDFKRGIFISTDYYSNVKTNRPYIRIKELTGKIGIDEEKIIYIKDEYPEDVANKLKENDIVVAIIGDTIGKANRIYDYLAGGFCSNNTARLRIKSENTILPEYAEILIQSLPIQKQIEKKKSQTGQPKISDIELKNILIPILPLSTQQKIASLVQQSHEARRKAKELLEIAKKAVEIAIENNEKEALEFISRCAN